MGNVGIFYIHLFFQIKKEESLQSNMGKFRNKINIMISFKEKLIFKNIIDIAILYLKLLYFNANLEKYFSNKNKI